MWELRETVPPLGDRHWHTAIKAEGFRKRLVLIFTDIALTWCEGAITSRGFKQSTQLFLEFQYSFSLLCINLLYLWWECKNQEVLFYSMKMWDWIFVKENLKIKSIKAHFDTLCPIMSIWGRYLFSDHILVCVCLRAPSTGLEWAVQVVSLQRCPGCARTSDHWWSHNVGNLSSGKTCLGRTRQDHICTGRQSNHNYNQKDQVTGEFNSKTWNLKCKF